MASLSLSVAVDRATCEGYEPLEVVLLRVLHGLELGLGRVDLHVVTRHGERAGE